MIRAPIRSKHVPDATEPEEVDRALAGVDAPVTKGCEEDEGGEEGEDAGERADAAANDRAVDDRVAVDVETSSLLTAERLALSSPRSSPSLEARVWRRAIRRRNIQNPSIHSKKYFAFASSSSSPPRPKHISQLHRRHFLYPRGYVALFLNLPRFTAPLTEFEDRRSRRPSDSRG